MSGRDGFVSVGDVRIHYLRWGHGPRPIVILHPNSHCGGVWTPLAERLAGDEFTVVAVDLRGHGRSDKPPTGYQWPRMREDIVTLITALDLRDLLLVGHSRGGGVALLTAAALPERVRGVLVYEPTMPFRPPTTAPVPITERMAARARARRSVFASREELFAHWRGRDAFRRWRDEYLRAYVEHGTLTRADGMVELACPPWVEAQMYEVMLESDAWTGVHCPDMPVVAIYGELSGRLGGERDPTAALRRMYPRCEVRVMPGATHFGPMEQPERFEAAIRGFAGRFASRRRACRLGLSGWGRWAATWRATCWPPAIS
jgi:pimeloyl-ACP methyl ester carboxylesterase